jgi:cellulose synthase/poly-beta-1,6-N-acetylglucosamine synthase-like glycosyltransferase
LIVAPKADGCSQKVANLREAVLHADERSRVFVFVDSDTRPLASWLRHIVAPLADERVGAATGYRWFISETPTFASEMRSVWNASIASALGPDTASNFCWGGSMAIRREIFERLEIREKWQGTLSDDFAVTRAMNQAKLPIVFVPQAITTSIESCTFGEMLEFTTRQMKITRVYARSLWLVSFFGSGLFNVVMIAAFLIILVSRSNSFASGFSVATILIVFICSVGKSWLRLRAVELVLVAHAAELRRQYWTHNTLWLLTPAVYFYNSLAALISRQLTWRGIRYELKSPTETVIIGD